MIDNLTKLLKTKTECKWIPFIWSKLHDFRVMDMGSQDYNHEKSVPCSAQVLKQELASFKKNTSALFYDFALNRMLADVSDCRVVKQSDKRQVYYLQSPDGEYFLKRSVQIRAKDRVRHFFLPRRRWAEWRNLHRLHAARISAALPVLRGEKTDRHPMAFFVLTQKVDGSPLRSKVRLIPGQLGQYLALLHSCGVYHADLHPENILIKPDNEICLIDVQEVFWLPWLPRRLRVYNLGKLFFHLHFLLESRQWSAQFLDGYNFGYKNQINISDLFRAANHHRQRHYHSRTKRCCKNSTEFVVVKSDDWRGYKRKTFEWSPMDLRQALEMGQPIKGAHVISYRGVCIKRHPKRRFHVDRCLISWKMSRALEARGIAVPRSLGYFVINNVSCFIAELLDNKCHLNTYLSSLSNQQAKRRALKKLAQWLRNFHDANVWQRDFKSNNILCQNGKYFMVDLDGVRIRRLRIKNKIYNLAQLNASVSKAVSIKDRLRFYHYYSADYHPTRLQRRAVYRKVWDITKTKNTKIYDLDFAELVKSQIKLRPNKSI